MLFIYSIYVDHIVGWALAHRFVGIYANLNDQHLSSVICYLLSVGWTLVHQAKCLVNC